ncbi:hypothetical protein [Sulfuricurvum sp.]|uniref:hypothetical protein n=1 Tax=Sulfuricurvum sp. TaxID=2025608 RepID=UPI0026090B91|nr:hypothetical protein [Sulfuricurvum sp.]MDD2780453.1 hypothetical protein [Sulfuricurvum sp.]
MMRLLVLSTLSCAYLAASTSTPITMSSDLNLTENQVKQLQRIDATLEQVKRHTYAKQIEVLNPYQRKLFCARQKSLCNTN